MSLVCDCGSFLEREVGGACQHLRIWPFGATVLSRALFDQFGTVKRDREIEQDALGLQTNVAHSSQILHHLSSSSNLFSTPAGGRPKIGKSDSADSGFDHFRVQALTPGALLPEAGPSWIRSSHPRRDTKTKPPRGISEERENSQGQNLTGLPCP
jgi:hypothetical protein